MGGEQDTNLLSCPFLERTCNLDRGNFPIRMDGLHKAKSYCESSSGRIYNSQLFPEDKRRKTPDGGSCGLRPNADNLAGSPLVSFSQGLLDWLNKALSKPPP